MEDHGSKEYEPYRQREDENDHLPYTQYNGASQYPISVGIERDLMVDEERYHEPFNDIDDDFDDDCDNMQREGERHQSSFNNHEREEEYGQSWQPEEDREGFQPLPDNAPPRGQTQDSRDLQAVDCLCTP